MRKTLSWILSPAVFCAGVIIALSVVLGYAVYYFTAGYETLTRWYLSLNGCFYRSGSWTRDFFTPAVKSVGNHYALAGILLCFAGIIYLLARWKKYLIPGPAVKIADGWPWYAVSGVYSFILWRWGTSLTEAGADEIFSVVNCSEHPPIQVLAYYMLPNNHVLFNFINGFLQRCSGADGVAAGRFFSFLAYVGIVWAAFFWLSRRQGKLWAALIVVPVSLQFYGWAFGTQARGYEWQLLCCWIAFITMFRYLETGERSQLKVNSFFCIAGFAFVPTFFYYFFAQLVFCALVQAARKKADLLFWGYQLLSAAGIFLFYLPALCFSGSGAMTGNRYVYIPPIPLNKFLPILLDVLRYMINTCFGFVIGEDNPVNFALFLLPLALFFWKDGQKRMLACFYITLWVVFVAICCFMRRAPYNRNMLMHYSISMAVVFYTCCCIIQWLLQRVGSPGARQAVGITAAAAIIVVYAAHQLQWNREHVTLFLYFNNSVNVAHDFSEKEIDTIPPGSTVAFSNERFTYYYYCRQRGYTVSRCPKGDEEWFLNLKDEPLPAIVQANYELVRTGFEGNEIYRRKK